MFSPSPSKQWKIIISIIIKISISGFRTEGRAGLRRGRERSVRPSYHLISLRDFFYWWAGRGLRKNTKIQKKMTKIKNFILIFNIIFFIENWILSWVGVSPPYGRPMALLFDGRWPFLYCKYFRPVGQYCRKLQLAIKKKPKMLSLVFLLFACLFSSH